MHAKIDWNHGKFNEKLWNNRWTLWVNQCTPWKNRVKQWKNRWTMQMVNFSSKIQQCFCSKMKQIAGKSAPDGKTNKKTRIILPKNATFLYKLQAASRGVQFNTRSLEAGAGHRSELKEGGRWHLALLGKHDRWHDLVFGSLFDLVCESCSVQIWTSEEDFLKVMIEENGTEGFRDSAVSVKILWRDIPESVIVADMPGMKDGDTDSSHFAYWTFFSVVGHFLAS